MAGPEGDATLRGIDTKLEELDGRKAAWAQLAVTDRLQYLLDMKSALTAEDHFAWASESSAVQGLDSSKPGFPERLTAADALVNALNIHTALDVYIRTLKSIASEGHAPPVQLKASRSGQIVAHVFPANFKEKHMNRLGRAGIRAEIWMEQGKPVTQAEFYRSPPHSGRLSLILGAGNQSFLSTNDVLNRLFVYGEVVVLKHHPLRAYNAKYIDRIFRRLIQDGFFWSLEGDATVGKHLVYHPLMQHCHMTGGNATHDAIVWGMGEEAQERRNNNTPLLQIPMTSELGSITPWIIVPDDRWTVAEMSHHARCLAVAFTSNNSCNCLSPKVLVLSQEWTHREQFMTIFRTILQSMPHPAPYYPGTVARYQRFSEQYATIEGAVEHIQAEGMTGTNFEAFGCEEPLPWMLIHLPQGAPLTGNQYALQNEAFSPVLAVVTLPGDSRDGPAFVTRASEFVNDHVWGTLSATIVVHPETQGRHPDLLEDAVAALNFGAVGVNCWTASCYGNELLTWGGVPGTELSDVGSGRGVVRNGLMFDHPHKSVHYTPFISDLHIGQKLQTKEEMMSIIRLILKPSFFSFMNYAWAAMWA